MKSLRYIERFHKLKAAGDILNQNLFPNLKEITESFSAVEAVFGYLLNDTNITRNSDIDLVVVGDGSTPRTAALFAYLTNWQCYSIDPRLNIGKLYDVKRLTVIKSKVEDLPKFGFKFEPDKRTIIVSVHSHAKVKDMWNVVNHHNKAMVHIPCCTHDLMDNVGIFYKDINIHSPKNIVYIWKDIDY